MTRRDLLCGGGAFVATALGLRLRSAQAAPRTHRITMGRMRFGTVPAGIVRGDTIVWVNEDPVPHTVTARDGSFEIVLAGRQNRAMTARRAGSFAFYCRYHPGMRGTLSVR